MDKKKEGSVVSKSSLLTTNPQIAFMIDHLTHVLSLILSLKVLNGLKQRILKLEQQCREKENALR